MSNSRLPLAIFLSTMGMEVSCLYLGLVILRENLGLSNLAFILILLLYPFSLFFKLMAGGSINVPKTGLILTAGLGIVTILLITGLAVWEMATAGYPPGGLCLQIVFCGLTWWLGNTLVRDEFSYQYICFRFQVCLLIFAILAVAAGNSLLAVIIFFTLGMVALALSRQAVSLSENTRILQPLRIKHIIVGNAVLLLPSIVILLALSPEPARAIVQVFLATASLLGNLFGPYQAPATQDQPRWFDFSCSFKPDQEDSGLTTPPPASGPSSGTDVIMLYIIGIVFVLVLLLIIFGIRRIKAKRRVLTARVSRIEINQIHLSLWAGPADFFRGIGRFLRATIQRILAIFKRTHSRTAAGDEPAMSILDLYRGFQHWAALRSLPRNRSQTPLEYLKALGRKFPLKDRNFRIITEVYIKARYSSHPLNSEEFEAAKKAWQNLKTTD